MRTDTLVAGMIIRAVVCFLYKLLTVKINFVERNSAGGPCRVNECNMSFSIKQQIHGEILIVVATAARRKSSTRSLARLSLSLFPIYHFLLFGVLSKTPKLGFPFAIAIAGGGRRRPVCARVRNRVGEV